LGGLLLGGLLLGGLLGGCAGERKAEIADRAGNRITMPAKRERIISAAPSNTEIIVDLGLKDRLVAADRYSLDIPGIPQDIPLIDFFNPDAEAIISLNPDLIIVSGTNQTGTGGDPFSLIREAGVAVVYIPMSGSITGIYEDIHFLAELLQVKDRGDALVQTMKTRIDAIAAMGRSIPEKQSVYFEISPPPGIATLGKNTYLHEMIELIGAENIFAEVSGVVFPSAEAIVEKNPGVILTNVNYTDDPLGELRTREGFETLEAVINNRIYPIDTNASSRPSHHILRAIEEMARAVYPEYYDEP
jgi:iron complex transport system substrate-binding protein